MKRRTLALLLAAALMLTALGATVLAAEGDAPNTIGVQETQEFPAEEDRAVLAAAESATQTEPDQTDREEPEIEEYIPDPIGSISFANLSRRMHENNLQILSIEQSVISIEELDYEYIKEGLREQLSSLSQLMWPMVMMGANGTLAYEHLNEANQALQEQYRSLQKGEMQADNADVVRQLKNLQNQIVMAGEATYIALSAMELQESGLERQLTALDRTLEELDLRYQLGHISSMTLKEAKAGRTALSSGLDTLRMNLDTYKGQLEMMIGADITGKIKLGALPAVTQKDLDSMDLERDLAAAKENSWSLYEAAETLKDEKKKFSDLGGENAYDARHKQPQYLQVRYGYYAARYTYDNTVQNFELGLRNLYLKVKDCKQILDAAKTALSVEQSDYSAAQLKYSQGTVSKNAMLEAKDKVAEAQDKVDSAANDLFSAYNTYRWAVDCGILN